MKIHKEGIKIVVFTWVILGALLVGIYLWDINLWVKIPLWTLFGFLMLFVVNFFRQPARKMPQSDNSLVYAPADGEVVVIEEVYEDEYLKEKVMQVSIFMSVWNVHMNWYPVGGEVEYYKYHKGKFLVAWLPKSSTENERTTTVVNTGEHKVLFRQIAGFVARRIINYSKQGSSVAQNQNCGFIKFGSRVDIFLPLGSDIKVKIGDKPTGTQTIIASLPKTK